MEERAPDRLGPSLDEVARKLRREWAAGWLTDPLAWRPGTAMPAFWPESDPDAAARRPQEVADIVAYLFERPAPSEAAPAAGPGDPERGRVLFDRKGCRACHALELPEQDRLLALGADKEEDPPVEAPRNDFGPPLGRIGSKTDRAWIRRWLGDPRAVFPETKMPRFRLQESERADLAAYLTSIEHPAWPAAELPRGNAEDGRLHVYMYGCGGCHELPGKTKSERNGPELDGFADKDPHQFDFGTSPPPLEERTWARWARRKLERPRGTQRPEIRLFMPFSHLSESDVDDLMVFLRSLRRFRPPDAYVYRPAPETAVVADGMALLEARNCLACHVWEEQGGEIHPLFVEPSMRPPTLSDLRDRLQPAWLFRYLRYPFTMRPWLTLQMADFGLDAKRAEVLARLVTHRPRSAAPYADFETPQLSDEELETAKLLLTKLRCRQCHGKTAKAGLQSGDLAPDLELTRQRLVPDWMLRFTTDPQKVSPGTRMPTFFPEGQTPLPEVLGGVVKKQIELLTLYQFTPTFRVERKDKEEP